MRPPYGHLPSRPGSRRGKTGGAHVGFGRRLAALRKGQGWSQAELAGLLGVETSMVSRYERGVYLPRIDKLRRIAELFSVSLDDLLGAPAPRPAGGPR